MPQRYDLIIVGMGSGGMVASEFASTLDLRVAVVERDRVGGDCLWTGCVPSKALIASARAAHAMRHAGDYGIEPTPARPAPSPEARVAPASIARSSARQAAVQPDSGLIRVRRRTRGSRPSRSTPRSPGRRRARAPRSGSRST